MTPERTQAYSRVTATLAALGPTKLQPAEQAVIRETADTLLFAQDSESTQIALRDLAVLTEHLLSSGRWLEPTLDALLHDILDCGPTKIAAAA